MAKTAWVTDSTAFLDDELKNNPDLYRIPLTILLDGEEFVDGRDLTAEQLFTKLKTLKNPPKTSQPSMGSFQELYEKLSEEYDQVIAVLLSSKLSGTFSSGEQAARLVEIPVTTIDSKILAYPLSAIIKAGMEATKEGKNLEEVIGLLNEIIVSNETYVIVGSLEQLHRSGRMSGLQFYLGSMLNVKPIISIEDGLLKVKEKARGEKKAKEKMLKLLRSSYETHRFKEAYILYGLHESAADEWKEELQELFPSLNFYCCPLGATIGVHAGENTLGISWFNRLT